MAVTTQFYNSFMEDVGLGRMNFATNVFKVMLVYNYTYNPAHVQKSQIGGEIAQANGYDGPEILENTDWGWNEDGGFTRFDADDITWTAVGGDIGPITGAVIYNDTITSPSADRLVCYIDFDGEDLITEGSEYKLTFNADGVFSITQET